jgi:hypothetical protein
VEGLKFLSHKYIPYGDFMKKTKATYSNSVEAYKASQMKVADAVERMRNAHEAESKRRETDALFDLIRKDSLCADLIVQYPEHLKLSDREGEIIATVAALSSEGAAADIANNYPALLKQICINGTCLGELIEKKYPQLWAVIFEAKIALMLDREGEEHNLELASHLRTECIILE